MPDILDRLREIAGRFAFDLVGVTSADLFARDLARLEAWTAEGHHGDLGWMARDPPERADPRTLMASVRSVLTVAVPHAHRAPAPPPGPYGRVARYAWGRDYHEVMLERLRSFAEALGAALGGGVRARAAVDHSPLLERAVSVRAGLGFFGKNTCVLLPRRGSFFLLGEVLVDAELPSTPPSPVEGCGTCTRCLPACPTGAFVRPFVLDARRCLSYLTIELKGSIPRALRPALGAWVFGCDVCQEVCPFNRFEAERAWPELEPSQGVGPYLDLGDVLSLPDEGAFRRRFAGTALLRPKRRGLVRNACVVARNVGAVALVPRLRGLVDDAEPLVREHALWALAGLDPDAARCVAGARAGDGDPGVAAEARAVLDGEA